MILKHFSTPLTAGLPITKDITYILKQNGTEIIKFPLGLKYKIYEYHNENVIVGENMIKSFAEIGIDYMAYNQTRHRLGQEQVFEKNCDYVELNPGTVMRISSNPSKEINCFVIQQIAGYAYTRLNCSICVEDTNCWNIRIFHADGSSYNPDIKEDEEVKVLIDKDYLEVDTEDDADKIVNTLGITVDAIIDGMETLKEIYAKPVPIALRLSSEEGPVSLKYDCPICGHNDIEAGTEICSICRKKLMFNENFKRNITLKKNNWFYVNDNWDITTERIAKFESEAEIKQFINTKQLKNESRTDYSIA